MSIWHQPGSIPALPGYVGTAGGSVKNQAPVEEPQLRNWLDKLSQLDTSLITSNLPVIEGVGMGVGVGVGVGRVSWLLEDSTWEGGHRYGTEGWVIANTVLSAMQDF
ncbi:hypothetical protein BOTNAR_0365g00030 [Botryotinia narcissicola]|uniref:Uncharacterized protein n=1 Tax=Botryotinia narcissicola TaxID=278944 RepID=A0A4Z1HPZ2_9HELO|nr:hypothetical protein BOTNAR_0365g00030 [Botryotinia narcissicola]